MFYVKLAQVMYVKLGDETMLARTLMYSRTSSRVANRHIALGGNTHIVRFYSQHNWGKYNEGSCDIESVPGKNHFQRCFEMLLSNLLH